MPRGQTSQNSTAQRQQQKTRVVSTKNWKQVTAFDLKFHWCGEPSNERWASPFNIFNKCRGVYHYVTPQKYRKDKCRFKNN